MGHRQRTGITAASQSILTDDPDFLRGVVERIVQAVLETEMTAHMHAEPYERSAERRGYRNGYKPRQLKPASARSTCKYPKIAMGPSRRNSSPATNAARRLLCSR